MFPSRHSEEGGASASLSLTPGTLAGRASTSATGPSELIGLGANLSMTGNVLSATASVALPSPTFAYEINHIICYGQSLSIGYAGVAPISTTQKYNALMFAQGLRPEDDYPAGSAATWYASLVAMVEAAGQTNTVGETVNSGTADMVSQMVLSENGIGYASHNYQMMGSSPGFSSTTIAQLSLGSTYFTRLLAHVSNGLSLSNAAGKVYGVPAVTWMQGERDYSLGTTRAAYTTSLNTLISDLNTQIKATSGQVDSVHLISYQVASHLEYNRGTPDIAIAQFNVSGTNALMHIAMAMYQFDYTGIVHLTASSYRWAGAYFGLAFKRIVIDKQNWKPLQPISSVRQGSTVVATFNVPKGVLVFDTTWVTAVANMGFTLADAAGTDLPITSVSIIDWNRVKIVATSAVPAGAFLRYGWVGTGNTLAGRTSGARGNLRDTQGNTIVFEPAGQNSPMHNWCLIFEWAL